MVSPRRITPRRQAELGRSGWYGDLEEQLRRLGYRGQWHNHRTGRFGLFSKKLRDLVAVRAEVASLQGLDLGSVMTAAVER